jgi:hypothetical protein
MPHRAGKLDKTEVKKKPYVLQIQIISALRKCMRMYPPQKEVEKRCRVERQELCKNGNTRLRVDYRCEQCDRAFTKKDWCVDHIEPVIDPEIGFVDWNTYISRMFCPLTNMQGLCNYKKDKDKLFGKPSCHRVKTSLEQKTRRSKK